ncbi:MAG TPA: hypothetical protein P5050_10125 [Bacteroidia bacterium]|nr:hypothetical protein [Bacteroidia bacterium]HRS59566.1 hypothetical protein [Bacteroidia bacterium]HRU67644.1 hypothetical protein [Bacteroidia bacterium]
MDNIEIKLRISRNDLLGYFIAFSTVLTGGGMAAIMFLLMDKGENIMLTGMLIWLFFTLIIIFVVARIYLRPVCVFRFYDDYFIQYFPATGKEVKHLYEEIKEYEENTFVYRQLDSVYFMVRFTNQKKKLVVTRDPLSEEAAKRYDEFTHMFREWDKKNSANTN